MTNTTLVNADDPHLRVAKAPFRSWLGLGVLGLTSLVVSMDLFVLLLALPQIARTLHATGPQLLWITDSYGFLLAGLMITMGALGDRIGRRRVLLIGSAAFALLSVLVACTQNAGMLIVARGLLGVAGAMIAPAALSLIRIMFPDPRENARAISVWLSCLMGGSILGPLIGGVLLAHYWWGAVFLLGVPPMLLALLLGRNVLPEFRNPDAARLHLPSVLVSLAAILPFIYGFKELAAHGVQALAVLAVLIGVGFAVIFVRQQRRLADPLLDLSLFGLPGFSTVLGAMLLNTMLPGGVMVLSTQYLQLVAGLSPLQAALWMIPAMAANILGFLLSPTLARRVRPAPFIALGLACSVASMLVLCLTRVDGALSVLIVGFALFNLGSGPLVTLGTGLVIGAAPPERAGAAAAISQAGNEFGFALGVAVTGSIGALVYRVHTRVLPHGLSADTVHAVRETLATAVPSARTLPGEVGMEVLRLVRRAFVQEYHTVCLLSALVIAATAMLIAVKLRGLPVAGGAAQDD